MARSAGVSRTTVSFVLNNTQGKNISEATRRRVLSEAFRLGYTPNEDARRLAMVRHNTIGLYICHSQFVYTDAFIVRTVDGMAQTLNRQRARLLIHPLTLNEESYLSLARHDAVDGIILINAHENDPALTELVASRYPVVAMDHLVDVPVDQVYVDNAAAARELVAYLVDLGHRSIAMVTHASLVDAAAKERHRGNLEALDAAGIPAGDALVRYGEFPERSGYAAMMDLMNLDERPTAVFAGNDVIAYGAMSAARDAGLEVPYDVSIVGFDDDHLSRYLNPPLTTIALPAAGMGAAAASLLLGRLTQGTADPPSHISVRGSCRRIATTVD